MSWAVTRRYAAGAIVTLGFLLSGKALFLYISYNPVIFVMVAIITVSWLYGRGPGVLSSFLVIVLTRPLFYPEREWTLDGGDVLRFGLFLLLTGFVSALVGARKKAEGALLTANEELDRRVRERTEELAAANAELMRANRALKEERERVESANEALRRANRDLEHFAYSASHDLQEPIRSVGIFSELLIERCGDSLDEDAKRYLSFVKDGAVRMESLVRGLLDYTRIGNPTEPGQGATEADRALERALQTLARVIRDNEATVVHAGLPRVAMHELHLQQLFQNLIGNAIKYRSRTRPHIVVSAKQEEEGWCFAIADNGIGIAKEYQEQVFGLFKRLHKNESYPGTGLGLAICRRIVEQYGGKIWVESQEGSGATFFFTVAGERALPAEDKTAIRAVGN